jgi:hypothetical protein
LHLGTMSHRESRDLLTLAVSTLAALIESNSDAALVAGAYLAAGIALNLFLLPTLRTPRAFWRQSDTTPIPLWTWTRSRRREAAFLRFLGFPTFLFDAIAEQMKSWLPPSYSSDIKAVGRSARFDHVDMTAIGLRALQIMSPKRLEIIMHEFGCGQAVASRSLRDAREALHNVAKS